MKQTPPNEFRVKNGPMPTSDEMGMVGIFRIPIGNETFTVVINDSRFDKKWEHVSASLNHRCPTWDEMCHIKSLFWNEDETVIQFHPKKSEYKNLHPYCLHLWRNVSTEHELPPSIYVA